MGRNVTLDFSAGGGSDTEFLIGTITLEPTAVHEIGNRIVLPAPRSTGINAGVGVLEDVAISPAGPEPAWAYRATVRDSISGKAQSWLVGVPTGISAIPFNQLTKFTTTIPPQTTAGMMQNWADTTEANADRSELAADRAEAPTDEMNKNLIEDPASLTAGALSVAIDSAVEDNALRVLFRSGGGLSRMFDALAKRNTDTARLVFLGSSTTAGFNATGEIGFVHMLAEKFQKAFPSTGSEIPVGTLSGGFTPSSSPGVQVVNLAGGGSTSANYMSPGRVNIIDNLQPCMVMHMVGSNDWNTHLPIATYRANLLSWMDQIDARLTTPCVHILVHQHSRQTFEEKLHPFTDYRDVQRELAFTFPGRIVHIDVAPEFARLGIPAPDPYAILDTDNIHLNDRGHRFLAELLWERMGLPAAAGGASLGPEPEPEPEPEPTLTMITSDGFSGTAADAGTRATDVAFGGSPITPTTSHAGQAVGNGVLTLGAFGTITYAHTTQDVQISIKVVTPQTSGAWQLYSRYSAATHALVKVRAVGQCSLSVKTAAGEQVYGSDHPVTAGTVVAVRSRGDIHELIIDGVVKTVANVPGVTGSTASRIRSEEDQVELKLDELKIAEVIPA